MILAMAVLRHARGLLSDRARSLQRGGQREAAQALWVLVEVIDEAIILLARKGR